MKNKVQRLIKGCVLICLLVSSMLVSGEAEARLLLGKKWTAETSNKVDKSKPVVGAEAAVLLHVETGEVLFSKNPNKWMHPASTTKIVTLLTAIEKKITYFDQLATISKRAINTEESSLELKAGDQIPLQVLLEGMMVASGNDAAIAVAETVSGSVEAFVTDMNEVAKKAGAKNTKFKNPHGLTEKGHYTTALDLAKISSYGMKMKAFRDMVDFDYYEILYENRNPEWVRTTNLFKRSGYEGVNGLKTGYTEAAGDCLVATVTREGDTLVLVLLNDDARWEDAPQLMDYGFSLLQEKKEKDLDELGALRRKE